MAHTTRNSNCLGGSDFPWGLKSNSQGNDSFLGGASAHSRKHIFLRALSKLPKNIGVSLAVSNHLQGNDSFSLSVIISLECYSQPLRKIPIFLAVILNRQVKYQFLEGYLISLEVGSQGNAYKYFGDSD